MEDPIGPQLVPMTMEFANGGLEIGHRHFASRCGASTKYTGFGQGDVAGVSRQRRNCLPSFSGAQRALFVVIAVRPLPAIVNRTARDDWCKVCVAHRVRLLARQELAPAMRVPQFNPSLTDLFPCHRPSAALLLSYWSYCPAWRCWPGWRAPSPRQAHQSQTRCRARRRRRFQWCSRPASRWPTRPGSRCWEAGWPHAR